MTFQRIVISEMAQYWATKILVFIQVVLKLKTTAAVVRGKKQLLPTIKAEGTSFMTLVGGKIQSIN